MDAAQLMVNIGGNPAGALAAMGSVSAMMGKSGMLGMAALGATAIVAGVGIAATKMAGDFEAQMMSIATGAGEATSALPALSAGVLQLAKDTGSSTKSLSDGLYMIESGGYRLNTPIKALDILKAAAEGAKVGNADLGVVADATDTILKNFGDTGLTAAQAVNTLIATVAHGKTHMEDLSSSLSQVLPTASSAGIGLNDVMGAMATMTAEGVPAAEAATYLRQTMIALSAPASAAKKEMESLGLSSTAVAAEMQKSLPGAMQMITDAISKKFPQGTPGYLAAMREIMGGMRQMQGGLDLGGKHIDAFNANVKTIAGAVKGGGSSIAGWTDTQKTFNLQLARAGEVAQTLMIQLGQKLLPTATKLFSWIADNAIPTGQKLIAFFTGTSEQAKIIRPILGVLAIVIGGALVASFVAWAASAAAAAVATIAATWPILAVGAAIALLVAGFLWAYNNVGWFRNAIQLMGTELKTIFRVLGDFAARMGGWGNILKVIGLTLLVILFPIPALIILIVSHWKDITTALGHFRDMLGNVAGKIGDFIGGVMGAIGGFVGHWIGLWLKMYQDTITHVKNMIGDLLGKIGQFKDDMIAHIVYLIVTTIAKFLYLKQEAIQHAKDLASGFMDALKALPGKLLTLGETLIKNLAQGIRNAAGNVASALKSVPLIGGIAGNLTKMIPQFATGGVMGQAGLALVGERGPELVQLPTGAQVSPLPSGASSLNSGGNLGGGNGSQNQQPIVINLVVDGKRLTQVMLPHLTPAIRNATGRRNF